MAGAQGRAECGRRRCTSKPGGTKRERVRRILPNVPDRKGCGPHVALRETFRSPVRDGTAALRRPRRCNREASHRTGVSPCPTARDAIGCHAAAGRTATRRRSRSRSASDGTSIATSSATGRSISRRSSSPTACRSPNSCRSSTKTTSAVRPGAGRTYANMFGLVERFIGAKVLAPSRGHALATRRRWKRSCASLTRSSSTRSCPPHRGAGRARNAGGLSFHAAGQRRREVRARALDVGPCSR